MRIAAYGVDARPREAYNGSKWLQYNPFEMDEKEFKISPPKMQKIDFLGPKNGKMTKKSNIFRKNFFGRNRFRMAQKCFKTKILILKKFYHWNFLLRDIAIFSKNGNYRWFGEHTSIGKGTRMYDGLKNPQNYFKNFDRIFLKDIIFLVSKNLQCCV